ncbi:hypothetical protein DOM21_14845 [Bacteriovorax stolpii]|uniref:tyrosine-type recombinase/integrase n=1 Tax=Bacteriovorax stolpii TaxID=960 RepID=UPI001159EDCF|nr:site-specific integrase [Bacteriovorax stolpii]QDK42704.1 hypothetical protein DOM21_14845 [Bacteriovorax stolpii]
MSINKVVSESGEVTWTVYANARSSKMPHIRFQKRVKGIKSRAEAERKEKSLLKEVTTKVAHKEGHGFTWKMVVERWTSVMKSETYSYKRYSPTVIADYNSMMYRWTKDWLNMPAFEINKGDARKVLDNVIEKGRTKAHQKKIKNVINVIYSWGIEERYITGVHQSPVYGLQISVIQDKRPEILKLEEIRILLYEAQAQAHPWYPIWGFALLSGMRNGELYALKWADIDLENGLITVERSYDKRQDSYKSTKAGYWRTVPISEELKSLIIDLKLKADSEFVLPRPVYWNRGEQAKVLKAFCRSINITPIKFHTLRACFATQLLGQGVEPLKVMKICGWRDLETMAFYIRLAGIDEKGVTENLRFLPASPGASSNVVSLFGHKQE